MSVNADTKFELHIFPFDRIIAPNVHLYTGIPNLCMVRDRANVKIYENFKFSLEMFHTCL